jgi:hypothetical protein
MRALVDRKVTNRITMMNNRLAEFATPVMRNFDLYVYRNFVVSGNEEIRGNSTIDGNLLVKGDGEIDGNLLVKGDEEVDGDLLVKGDEQVNGNVNADGYILAKTFLPGQVINVSMLSNTELGQSQITVAATATRNVFTYSYTPKYSTSYLIIEYQSIYWLDGGGTDQAYAYLNVNDGTGHRISYSYQKWLNTQGGGDRSSILFPLIGRYTNTNTASKLISVDLYNGTDADPITVNSDTSTWLKITEVGR